MNAYRIVEVPAPAAADVTPTPAYLAISEIEAEHGRETVGHEDLADPPERLVAAAVPQRHSRHIHLIAVSDDVTDQPSDPAQVLGVASLDLPMDDNTHFAELWIGVRAAHRRRGIGRELWRAAEEHVLSHGRTTVAGWSAHGGEATEAEEAVHAESGVGRIRAADAAAIFARRLGFTLEQTERQSTLRLPIDPQTLQAWRLEAQSVAGQDYRLVQWLGRTPERWLEEMAELNRRMSTDVPMADLDMQEESWDAGRVSDYDDRRELRGMQTVLSAAEHVPTGVLAAYTFVVLPRDKPEVAYQENTLVRAEHRGNRLGLLVKAANVEQLADRFPQVRRIHTWNAGENEHMLAINIRMGFQVAAVEGAWQLRLTPRG